ncbi:hypothetical protein BDY17DRAFT_289354 [Neohortaea acidophila]|uniref:Uncharacterized protein n=1 Tax=Neohortaea acidophila TaxID=245834 RepID=A0A6A6Q5Q6_9PEZI|nr:uncharacterized protein BDY17DRAFT_289354 [Neohortaea acidophila]KAF2487645.1 hypothetical protein BDY17DRAFT_289354 [Neohortaea acidophila]
MDEAQLSQDSLSSLNAAEIEQPVTPNPPHATLPESSTAAVAKLQAGRIDNATQHMTPPPSTQLPSSSQRGKARTPTPPISHISTPPPTNEMPTQSQPSRVRAGFADTMTPDQIAAASPEELRTKVTDLQASLQEAKMSAAHHKLQYQMLSQESAAAIERMAVEARMSQYENEVIHLAEQAKAAATPVQPSAFVEGMIPVQKDLYQRMCGEIQQLTAERNYLADEQAQNEKVIMRQDFEIASLTDKVTLMRERIQEHRQHMQRHRRAQQPSSRVDSTPRSTYNDPLRSGVSSQEQPQPFAALLQASEMASQEAHRPSDTKKGHARNTHSMSSLPATPSHSQKRQHSSLYYTPHGRQSELKVPSTAPLPRTSAMRTPDVYSQNSLPIPYSQGPPSDGTVSAPEDDDDDSEAETEIIEQDEVSESQASRAASQMLRSSREHPQPTRGSFTGSGVLQRGSSGGDKLKQTKLFGQVRKASASRDDERPSKRARVGQPVGLGIVGVRD